MDRRKIVALAVPVAVLLFALGFFVALEVQRAPNWQLELEDYVARQRSPSETVRVATTVKAARPWNFDGSMGEAEPGDWIIPSYPPQAVRCVLLVRGRPLSNGSEEEAVRQVVYLVHHSDALYRVGWLAYAGPEEPFDPGLAADLEEIGCDLALK